MPLNPQCQEFNEYFTKSIVYINQANNLYSKLLKNFAINSLIRTYS